MSRRRFLLFGLILTAIGSLALFADRLRRVLLRRKCPAMISRAEWGALEPDLGAPNEHGLYDRLTNPEGWLAYPMPLAEVLRTVVVHHSALTLSDGPREIQDLHRQNKGFADIAYHYLIDYDGHPYEGRSITVRGAHVAGFNTGSVGICLLGNFEAIAPAPAQLATLKELIACLIDEYGLTYLAGHRDFNPTETQCPGKNLEPLLPGLAAELRLKFGTGGYAPPDF